MKNKLLKFSYRFLLILVSTIFIFAGVDKIILKNEMVELFKSFGLPKEMMIIVGFTELMLAILLQTKYFTKLATHGLLSILFFGLFFHLVNTQFILCIVPIILISILFITLNLGHRVKNLV